MDNGRYIQIWFHDWQGWEPVELEHSNGNICLYMINGDCPCLIPNEVSDDAYLYTPQLCPPGEQPHAK